MPPFVIWHSAEAGRRTEPVEVQIPEPPLDLAVSITAIPLGIVSSMFAERAGSLLLHSLGRLQIK